MTNWKSVITKYIDDLDDTGKKQEYLEYLLANFYSEKLLATRDIIESDLLEFNDTFNKVKKIKVTAKNNQKLRDYYDEFVDKEWLENSSIELGSLESKKCFYNIWICRAIIEGDGVYPATHVAKLSHSKSSSVSISDKNNFHSLRYLSTNSLNNLVVDGAYPNSALAKIAKFLLLKHDGKLLSEELLDRNLSALEGFSDINSELNHWMDSFFKQLTPSISSSDLAKQIYFPVKKDYHLLTVLKSSSLLQSIFLGCFEKSARKEREQISKIVSKEKYTTTSNKILVNVAKVFTVSSQPQNVSVLSGARSGAIRLFSTQPPTWEKQLKPPIYTNSFFYQVPLYSIKDDLDYLSKFLSRFKRLELSIRDTKRKAHLERWVNSIIDSVFFYVASIQNLPSGWSNIEGIKLDKIHQYLIDPYRTDKEFITQREAGGWQSQLCNDFANWLNHQLKKTDKTFTPQAEHKNKWVQLFKTPLREDVESIKVVQKQLSKMEEEE